MNAGTKETKAAKLALMGKFIVAVAVGMLGQQQVLATTQDELFLQYVNDICSSPPNPAWSQVDVGRMCTRAFTGGPSGGPVIPAGVSSNLGTVNAGSGIARKNKEIRVPLEEQKEKPDKGASADGGGWGLLVTPQYSKSNRLNTDLENGYESKLTGLVIGVDYRFSDSFVLGLAFGSTKDKANFNNDVGFLDSSNNTATLYGTWLYSESVGVDGYLGYGKLNLDSQRQFDFGLLVSGLMSGNTTGQQTLAGFSVSYLKNVGRFNLTPSFNLDYIKTSIKSYNESGSTLDTTLFALHYGDRSVTSLTGSLGVSLSTSYGYDWGALIPSARFGAVHEFQNRTRQISNELISTPGTGFSVTTDEPDRNYLNLGLGVAAALNGGTQLFFDFEKRSQDNLLSSWAVSLGGLVEF